jgi:23S rRNA pseudouridine1911/1915/1917 synthase
MPHAREPVPVLYEDAHLLVVSKPAGMLSVPTPGASGLAVAEALERLGIRGAPVHRLDREVSGAVIVALDDETRAGLEDAFRERKVEKTYWALAQGRVKPAQGVLRHPILEQGSFARVSARGKPATTRYRTIERLPTTTVLEIDLVTGRYNQIRVHLAHAGFPLVGERKYARGKDSPVRIRSRRVALHAWRVALVHPRTGERIEVEAPIPDDLRDVLARASAAS